MPRLRRKDEHLYLSLKQKPRQADFLDISLLNNCLPEIDLEEVNLETSLLGMKLRSPLFINAVTGGTRLSMRINYALACTAHRLGIPMAVGSQMAALEHPATAATFQIVREANPQGIIWANLGSYATPEQAVRAVEMVGASAVQIHLNVPQELAMGEGDCNFKGCLQRIREVVKAVPVPVAVKEVGFGIAAEQAAALVEAGVSAIDVGGRGGTNFLAIERKRAGAGRISRELLSWGIPTAISLIEVLDAVRGRAGVIAAGGMHSSLNMAKALALGAAGIGLAALPVYVLMKKGPNSLIKTLAGLERELRLIMLMAGASSLSELQRLPLVITGFTAEWLARRGINPDRFARRNR